MSHARSYYVHLAPHQWAVRWWDATRSIWLEGRVYRTRREVLEALKESK